jgi:hypothetical protein
VEALLCGLSLPRYDDGRGLDDARGAFMTREVTPTAATLVDGTALCEKHASEAIRQKLDRAEPAPPKPENAAQRAEVPAFLPNTTDPRFGRPLLPDWWRKSGRGDSSADNDS